MSDDTGFKGTLRLAEMVRELSGKLYGVNSELAEGHARARKELLRIKGLILSGRIDDGVEALDRVMKTLDIPIDVFGRK